MLSVEQSSCHDEATNTSAEASPGICIEVALKWEMTSTVLTTACNNGALCTHGVRLAGRVGAGQITMITQQSFSCSPVYTALAVFFLLFFGAISIYATFILVTVLITKQVDQRGVRIAGLAGLSAIAWGLTVGSFLLLLYFTSLTATIGDGKVIYRNLFEYQELNISEINRVDAYLHSAGSLFGGSWVEIDTNTGRNRLDFRFMPHAVFPFEMAVVEAANLRLSESGYIR